MIYIIILISIMSLYFTSNHLVYKYELVGSRTDYINEFNKLRNLFFCFILFLFMGFRYKVGTDYNAYVVLYQDVLSSSFLDMKVEPVFYLLINAIDFFNSDVKLFFVWTSFLTCFFYYMSMEKKESFFSMILFLLVFYLPAYSLVRQALATCVFLYGFSKFDKNKVIGRFYILISAITHFSLIMPALLFFIPKPKFSLKNIVVIIAVIIIVVLPLLYNLNILYDIPIIGYKIKLYATNSSFYAGSGVSLSKMVLAIWLFCCILMLGDLNSTDKLIFLNYSSVIYMLSVFLSFKFQIISRFADLFSYCLVLYPIYYVKVNKKKSLWFKVITIFLYAILYVNLAMKAQSSLGFGLGITPYRSWF